MASCRPQAGPYGGTGHRRVLRITFGQSAVIPFLLLALVLSAAAPGPADPVCNGASGVCVDPRFRSFYDDLNGVVFLGTPESGPVDRGRLVVQYFQRGTLELNPVNGVIRQGDTGLELVRHRLPFAAGPIPEDSPAHLYIPETGYSVSHSFKSFYLSNGGRDRFGPPISPLLNDEAPWAQYVQYFTKARLEYRPESGAPFGVEIGNVGYELYQAYLRGPQNPPPATLQYGIQVHTWYALQHREILRPAAEAGFGWVKQLVKWSQIEPAEGQFDWLEMDAFVEAAEFDGLKALVTVVEAPPWARISPLPGPPDDLEKFKTFMRALATRYAGRIQAYELWNEPNLARFWSGKVSPEGYVELLGSGYGGVKAADPQALVLFAGLAQNGAGDLSLGLDDVDFLRAAYRYREGLVKHFFDAMGEHSYGYRSPPGAEYDRWFDDSSGVYLKHPSFFFKRFEQIRAVMEEFDDSAKPIWMTEFGWTPENNHPDFPFGVFVTEQDQADFTVEAFQMVERDYPYVQAMFLFNLNFRTLNLPGESEHGFSVLDADFSPRPVYLAVKAMDKTFVSPARWGG